jgi:hypothetical protein
MHSPWTPVLRRLWRVGLAAALAWSLAACGGGDDPAPAGGGGPATPVQISGLAATGAAIGGATVTATNAQGLQATAVTAADGSFTVSISDGAPFVLSVTDGSGKSWYSYAPAAGRANLTPLTTLALLQANGGKPLADLVAQWKSSPLTADQVLQAAKTVNANLQGLLQAQGLDPASLNVFTQTFSANHSGLDAVLDAMRVSISCSASACSQSITSPAGQVLLNWNGNIATTGITLSWSAATTGGGSTGGSVTVGLGSCKAPVAGTWSLVVTTTVSGVSVPIPEVCVDGLPDKPASQADFCGSSDVKGQLPPGVQILSCTYANDTGTITARITQPITIDYTVKYVFVKR